MRPSVAACALSLALIAPLTALALPPPCNSGTVYEDRNGNGRRDDGEPGLGGIRVSDGVELTVSDAQGAYHLPVVDGRSSFVIKPAGYRVGRRDNGLPDFSVNVQREPGPKLKYGGVPASFPSCRDYALISEPADARRALDVLVFADPQPKTATDVGYYRRDIIEPLLAQRGGRGAIADLGLSLGDIVHDDLSLYPALNRATALLGVPWLHAPGNHDLDFDAARDEDSLASYRHVFGPDTYAWEEHAASFVMLDDVIYRPGQNPSYIGGLRDEQFAFLERYLAGARKDRLLVIGVHIPFFDAAPGRETFRRADRERLFALLREFPRVLLLSGHGHIQRHVYHDAQDGWHGAAPLHEYNVGAACGAFWSGIKDAQGIPAATMADGTPNGYARLGVGADGAYRLSWHPARLDAVAASTPAMSLHAPRVLRRGAYPAFGVYANVYMGQDESRVEFRVDEGAWAPMRRVAQADPNLQAENARDDQATALRGYDRSPEAEPSQHLWRAALPTDLAVGEHRIEVRTLDPWQGEQRASTVYRLQDAKE
ncbi:calcineurin-like phosphoesterase family protein [Lysobacter sp. 5GHs7-4]|uniref:calcineurin-like phosphoesterase C-terminal domain-containing protein n=1 Tax=Lysobacter sp. 5GHs7-4 TaxID=2904253 RepID=UPI001E3CD8AB|nr:calcineurin-like phosphoesterase family protein [Lysobacter sp. 5GHs7-4]UHQ24915.1 calcineurin-like phosphoesterase family protein [Lysobacter sp. 5GHs7-4]